MATYSDEEGERALARALELIADHRNVVADIAEREARIGAGFHVPDRRPPRPSRSSSVQHRARTSVGASCPGGSPC